MMQTKNNLLKIAITGNIASGKSEVENILAKNFPVYDSDKIAHEILGQLTDFYGLDVFTNGKIDRQKLGKLVFSDKEIKSKLENIVHPKVKDEINKIFEEHCNDKVVFVSVPLLFEVHFENLFDKILFISVDEQTRIKRLMQRNNLTEEEALRRINSQAPEQEKITKSDFVIKNNSSLDDLEKEVLIFIRKLHSFIHLENT